MKQPKIIQVITNKDGLVSVVLYDDGAIFELRPTGEYSQVHTTGLMSPYSQPVFAWFEIIYPRRTPKSPRI